MRHTESVRLFARFNSCSGHWFFGVFNRIPGQHVYLSNSGTPNENGVIRIGTLSTQTSAYLAGVVPISSDSALYIEPLTGQLGTLSSSQRYKEEVQDIGDASDALMRLRPVSSRYKQPAVDGSKPIQYGLIAEEVEQVYPEAVLYNTAGQVDSVQYNKVNALLLNEVQKQRKEIDELKLKIETLLRNR